MTQVSARHGRSISLLLLLGVAGSIASATPQTWVSGLGTGSSCTLTAPCSSIATALSQTDAGGEVSILDPGPYTSFTITKSVAINAVGAIGSIVPPPGTTAITIQAGPSDTVTLRGLSLNGGSVDRVGGATTGVHFQTGGRLHIDACTIAGFTTDAILFAPSGSSALLVNNTSMRANNTGAYVRPTVTGSADASFNGVKTEYNSRGIRIEDGGTAVVRNSVTSNNTGSGFIATSLNGRAVTLAIENSEASRNGASGIVTNGSLATVRLSNVTATDNTANGVLGMASGQAFSSGNDRFAGNLQGNVSAGTVLQPLNPQ
jgi:hypothetical protein